MMEDVRNLRGCEDRNEKEVKKTREQYDEWLRTEKDEGKEMRCREEKEVYCEMGENMYVYSFFISNQK